MDQGLEKTEMYKKIADDLGIPRPTIRRVARDLRQLYDKRIKQLQSDQRILEKKIKNG